MSLTTMPSSAAASRAVIVMRRIILARSARIVVAMSENAVFASLASASKLIAPDASRRRSVVWLLLNGERASTAALNARASGGPLVKSGLDHRRHRLRQHDRSDQARAQNAERDLLGARHRGVLKQRWRFGSTCIKWNV
jgi:hypothetical protein